MSPIDFRKMLHTLREFEFVILCHAAEAAKTSKLLFAATYPRPFGDAFPAGRADIALPELKQVLFF